MEIQIILALAALGCCTGFLAGLLGIGGGMVLTPFLTLLLGYAGIPIEHIVHVAIATSMLRASYRLIGPAVMDGKKDI